ncbi:hypothetical protein LguiA_027026 [Lonicera macranthoides]
MATMNLHTGMSMLKLDTTRAPDRLSSLKNVNEFFYESKSRKRCVGKEFLPIRAMTITEQGQGATNLSPSNGPIDPILTRPYEKGIPVWTNGQSYSSCSSSSDVVEERERRLSCE